MNYLAHALPHLHDPWVVAGTSLPDWLRFVRVRLPPNRLLVSPDVLSLPAGSAVARLRAGVLQHHQDDRRFHADARFEALTAEVTLELRALERDPRFRASTIAHVAVEMLIDAALLRSYPESGDHYYAALEALDARELAAAAQVLVGDEVPHLPVLHRRFLDARFILSYASDAGVLRALDGVLVRTGLPAAPRAAAAVIARARPRVAALAGELFPR